MVFTIQKNFFFCPLKFELTRFCCTALQTVKTTGTYNYH